GHAWTTRPCRGIRGASRSTTERRRICAGPARGRAMAEATLTINSRNYGSWSLRGFLLCRMAGLDCTVEMHGLDDASSRAELLLLSPSFLVPCLTHDGIKVWDTLAIGEYLNELKPEAGLLPKDRPARAHWR